MAASAEHNVIVSWVDLIPPYVGDHHYTHVKAAGVIFLFILVLSLLANRAIKGQQEKLLVPPKRLTLAGIFDFLIEAMYGMFEAVLGSHTKQHYPFLATTFLFILLSNLMGLFPHSASATANLNTTLSIALCSFVYYNWAGIKAHGAWGYLKHFTMGLGAFGVIIAAIEMISHAIRPVSLAIRLYVNMHVDHTLVGVFASLFEWLLTVPFLCFGILVSLVQAFVFTILTAAYIQMAEDH